MTSTLAWEDIIAVTGGQLGAETSPCPLCSPNRKPAHRRLKVFKAWQRERDYATYSCTHCGVRGWVKPERESGPANKPGLFAQAFHQAERAERQAEAERESRAKIALAEFSFFSAQRIAGTPAEAYLASRALCAGDDMRFSPLAPRSYDDDAGAPGMVVAVRNVAGVLTGAQVTHLTRDGRKLKRLTFGKVTGGAVRLAQIGQDGVLAVAEGVETARAFQALYGVPCWAALSAGGLEQFDPPHGVRRLIVAADNDENGRGLEGAQILAKRAQQRVETLISMPGAVGDWADELTRRPVAA